MILALLVVVFALCGTAAADKIALTPATAEVECDGAATSVEAHYKGQSACGFDLLVDWSNLYLDDVTADDFEIGDGWPNPGDMYWNAWDCTNCAFATGRHIHVQIIDGSYEGVTTGCIFGFDVHDEYYCDQGETEITVLGVAYDCDDPPNYIEPLLFPQGCTVTITSE